MYVHILKKFNNKLVSLIFHNCSEQDEKTVTKSTQVDINSWNYLRLNAQAIEKRSDWTL